MNRRAALFLSTILAFTIPVSLPALDFTPGVTAGSMLSWASGPNWDDTLDDDDGEDGPLLSFTWGAFLRYGITDRVSIQPEFLFTLRGGIAYFEYPAGDFTGTYTLPSMEIPLFLRVLLPFGKGGFVFMAGPDLFLALDDIEYRVEYEDGGFAPWTLQRTAEAGVRLGIALSAGYEYPAGPALLTGEIRYSRPFIYPSEDIEMITNAFSLLFGIGFPV